MDAVASWQELYILHPTQSFMLASVGVQHRKMAHGEGEGGGSNLLLRCPQYIGINHYGFE